MLGKTWFLVTCEPYYNNSGILISTFTYFISLDHHDQLISNLGFADNGAAYLLFH